MARLPEHAPERRRTTAGWAGLGAATLALGWALDLAGLPSSYLFAALVAGIAAALAAPDRLAVPRPAFAAAQAAAGVVLGTMLDGSSLDAVAESWLPLALVTAATLAISLAAGIGLARWTGIDLPTAALGMVAGGASGIVGIADELGADDRLVAFMQYLRVLVIVLLMPVLVAVLFPGEPAAGQAAVPLLGDATGWLRTTAIAAAGVAAAGLLRIPGGTLLLPMGAAGALSLAVPGGGFDVPRLLQELAFALIGAQVGLKFTLGTIRLLGRLLVPVLVAVAGVLAACALLALALELTTPVGLRDAYLATTPGGLYAVLAVALGADADAPFILAAQSLRLVVMVALAPVVVRALVHSRAPQRE